MADQCSFDIVSEVNMQELKNALDQATKEIRQRFDFKDSKTDISLKEKEKELVVLSDDEYKLRAVQEIINAKCVKRGVSLKAFSHGAIEPALSGTVRRVAKIQSGLASEKAKEISKSINDNASSICALFQRLRFCSSRMTRSPSSSSRASRRESCSNIRASSAVASAGGLGSKRVVTKRARRIASAQRSALTSGLPRVGA